MSIRENMINNAQPGKQKELFIKFWEQVDKLWIDVETIPTYYEYRQRFSKMYGILFEACELTGDFYLIDLFGLENKATSLFSKDEISLYNYFS